ncbi:MAG: glycoside hydrolase family 43 protein, partial [Candidatus Xenobia bacterium]
MRTSLLLVMLLSSLALAAPYRNPVIGTPPYVDHEVADQFVLKWNGEYWLYCSDNPITAFHSVDLVHWDALGPVFTAPPGQTDVWAPEVVYRNGQFYMYYSVTKQSTDWRVQEANRHIAVAVADRPEGPFVDSGKAVTPYWAIDATIFRDPDSGDETLFASYLDEAKWHGAGIIADRMKNPFAVAGQPSLVSRGNQAWEDKDGNPGNGSVRYTNEGPTVLKHDGHYYLMYSGGSWDLPTYALGWAWSDRIFDGGLDGPGWHKMVPPLLQSTGFVEGPGHNAVVKAPNNFDDICFYHARSVPFLDPWNRLPFAQRLLWNHDRMMMAPPDRGWHTAPDQPLFADRFVRQEVGPSWSVVRGDWQIVGGALQQQQETTFARIVPQAPALTHYLLEANVKLAHGHSGRAGVCAVWMDEGNQINVWLDASRHALVVTGELAARPQPVRATALPADFRFEVFHQLLIARNGQRITIWVDGVVLDRLFLEKPGRPGTVALQTDHAQAQFAGIALTAGYEDTFKQIEFPLDTRAWHFSSGQWSVKDGSLYQASTGRAIALKGDPTTAYEFSASMRAEHAGIVAGAAKDDMITASYEHAIWPLARFRVQRVQHGKVTQTVFAHMPRGFDYNVFHTIRVVRQGDGWTFWLDGQEEADLRAAMAASQPGIFSDGNRAVFDDCRMKWASVPANLVLDGSFESQLWDDDGSTFPGNVWTCTGTARPSLGYRYAGERGLVIRDGPGTMTQTIPNLPAGHYVLHAFARTWGDAHARLNQTAVATTEWSPVQTDITLSAPAAITVTLQASPGKGSAA